jgi:hypothetical protein
MHLDADATSAIQAMIGCRVEGFPQTYLGLPLSCDQLRMVHFAPLITKVDKYLSGWISLLLSSGGRIVLLNAVLDALPAYAMGALELPPALLRAIDALRRAFLWNFSGRASGARCLVAWELVCRPKEIGGLGIRRLEAQNSCLLVKLVHRLHAATASPWARWAWESIGGPISVERRTAVGSHWRALVGLMPLYRTISKVALGDGARTAFWSDDWSGSGALCASMPALFTHATNQLVSVAAVMRDGIRHHLVPRLTTVATTGLASADALLGAIRLSDGDDSRSLSRCAKKGGELHAAALYKLSFDMSSVAPFAAFVWGSYAPSKAKFFCWLLVQNKIQSRAALHKKNVLSAANADCAICHAPSEDASHIIFNCPFARQFWAAIGVHLASVVHVENLHAIPCVVPGKTSSTFAALCYWNIWKHRNNVAFRGDRPCLRRLVAMCRDDAHLWVKRVPAALLAETSSWLSCLGDTRP